MKIFTTFGGNSTYMGFNHRAKKRVLRSYHDKSSGFLPFFKRFIGSKGRQHFYLRKTGYYKQYGD